jgi:hypothetical protein
MKCAYFFCLSLSLIAASQSQSNLAPPMNHHATVANLASAPQTDPKVKARLLDQYGKLPLSFEANHGQADARVKFLSRTGEYSLFLTGDEAVLTLPRRKASTNESKVAGSGRGLPSEASQPKAGRALRMKLRNANPATKVSGVDELAGTSNYFIGTDPKKWRTSVPTFAKVRYEGIYSGIDLVYYGSQRQLEYDFIVAPGADPHRIAFDVEGAQGIRQDAQGDLIFRMGEEEIRWRKPVVYQKKNGARQLVAARYAVANNSRVTFELAKHDASRALYIDPLIYSTYLGGSGQEWGYGIAVDNGGNVYVTGDTSSTDFPTENPLQATLSGGADVFITKINPTGSGLVYSTYLGGSGADYGAGIALDSAGNAYVTGTTNSPDFPLANPLQAAFGNGIFNAFIAELNSTGSALVYSTYLGGTGDDRGQAIAVDTSGNTYVTGSAGSSDFPTTPGAFQTACEGDAFVAKVKPRGSAWGYVTCVGGNNFDFGYGIAVDSTGNAYITGVTNSADFPTKNALQPAYAGNADAFVSKLNPAGSALVYSTYLGGGRVDVAAGIALDNEGNAYIAGSTCSEDFPTMNALQAYAGGNCLAPYGAGDAFVTKLNSSGSALIYSTYIGGRLNDNGLAIAVDNTGSAYVGGWTESHDFPLVNSLQKLHSKGNKQADAFVSKINPEGSALAFSSFLGGASQDEASGIAVDSTGNNAYVVGFTSSTNFPITSGAFQTVCKSIGGPNGCQTAFVAKIDVRPVTTTTVSSSPNPSTSGQEVTFVSHVSSVAGAPPDGETVTFKHGTIVLGTGTLSAGSASFSTSKLKVGTTAVTAVYAGDADFIGSKSKAVKQVVSAGK